MDLLKNVIVIQDHRDGVVYIDDDSFVRKFETILHYNITLGDAIKKYPNAEILIS